MSLVKISFAQIHQVSVSQHIGKCIQYTNNKNQQMKKKTSDIPQLKWQTNWPS